jgi:hypothetical protein
MNYNKEAVSTFRLDCLRDTNIVPDALRISSIKIQKILLKIPRVPDKMTNNRSCPRCDGGLAVKEGVWPGRC